MARQKLIKRLEDATGGQWTREVNCTLPPKQETGDEANQRYFLPTRAEMILYRQNNIIARNRRNVQIQNSTIKKLRKLQLHWISAVKQRRYAAWMTTRPNAYRNLQDIDPIMLIQEGRASRSEFEQLDNETILIWRDFGKDYETGKAQTVPSHRYSKHGRLSRYAWCLIRRKHGDPKTIIIKYVIVISKILNKCAWTATSIERMMFERRDIKNFMIGIKRHEAAVLRSNKYHLFDSVFVGCTLFACCMHCIFDKGSTFNNQVYLTCTPVRFIQCISDGTKCSGKSRRVCMYWMSCTESSSSMSQLPANADIIRITCILLQDSG